MCLLRTVEIAAVSGDAADVGVSLYCHVNRFDVRCPDGAVRMRPVKRDADYEGVPRDC